MKSTAKFDLEHKMLRKRAEEHNGLKDLLELLDHISLEDEKSESRENRRLPYGVQPSRKQGTWKRTG